MQKDINLRTSPDLCCKLISKLDVTADIGLGQVFHHQAHQVSPFRVEV
jgi:hypothetical protein